MRRDGCYSVRRPSGVGFVVQYADGRLVECLGPVRLENPPKAHQHAASRGFVGCGPAGAG
jgi:hypothetical protein